MVGSGRRGGTSRIASAQTCSELNSHRKEFPGGTASTRPFFPSYRACLRRQVREAVGRVQLAVQGEMRPTQAPRGPVSSAEDLRALQQAREVPPQRADRRMRRVVQWFRTTPPFFFTVYVCPVASGPTNISACRARFLTGGRSRPDSHQPPTLRWARLPRDQPSTR